MEEATQPAKPLVPPGIMKKTGYKIGLAQETPHGVEHPPANESQFASKNKRTLSKPFTLESDLFEVSIADAKLNISMLFTQFAEFLSIKATADNSQMKELEGILREAQNHECYLKEKKEHLTQTLTLISEKLQSGT